LTGWCGGDMRGKTCILLSVHNGATFLREQLDSLAAQSDPGWILLWRDDGSSDGSAEVVERFAAEAGAGRVRHLPEPTGRLGVAGSFLALLRAAPEDAARVAFCDQDDVWLPDKLARAAAALAAVPPGTPGLYCARQVLVDWRLRRIGLSPDAPRGAVLGNALVQNIATGCTVVLNRAARTQVLAVPPPAGTLHDWWAYLVVAATGGQVIFDAAPAVLYRQHGGNAVGGREGRLARALAALLRGPETFLGAVAANAAALTTHPALTPEARRLLDALGGLRAAGPLARLGALSRSGLGRQGRADSLLLKALFALHPLPAVGRPGGVGPAPPACPPA
jgi:hypothetical protein